MTFVWKITSSKYCPAHKNKPSFQPKGDTLTLFTAVFWNLGRPRNSWHHWPCISTLAAAGCTHCSAASNSPRVNKHCRAARTVAWTVALALNPQCSHGTHHEYCILWTRLQKSKGLLCQTTFKPPNPSPALPGPFPLKRLASLLTSAILPYW